MDRNLLLAFALSFAVLALWTMTQEAPPRRPAASQPAPDAAGEVAPGSDAPPGSPALPTLPPALDPDAAPAVPIDLSTAEAEPAGEAEIIRIETHLYAAELTSRGAGLRHWELKQYDEGPRRGHVPLVLTTGQPPLGTAGITPFEELGRGDLSQALWDVEQVDAHTVLFRTTRDGVEVKKVFHFEEDAYDFRLQIEVVNGSDAVVEPRFGVVWPAHIETAPDFQEQALIALHDGSVEQRLLRDFGNPGFFSREPELVADFRMNVDWAGVQTTYFLSALLPSSPSRASARFIAVVPGKAAATQLFFEPETVPPGKIASQEFKGYLGPKVPEQLEAVGSETIRAIDLGYSWLAPMTRAFNWMLHALYSIIPNYGVAIILLTILVRAVTAPLTVKQMRSMERMRALSPKLKELQEKFKDDRQKQSEETMRLYRQEKVNPLGGCFPMLLQLPVFIGLFYALRSSIQLRQAPFFGWIDDLSVPEALFTIPGPIPIPIRVLPLIMGATMVLQQRLTPMPSMDPAQARMMQTVMPIMMTALFYQFPSGLVLYWMVSNILAIAHQRWIGRNIHATA